MVYNTCKQRCVREIEKVRDILAVLSASVTMTDERVGASIHLPALLQSGSIAVTASQHSAGAETMHSAPSCSETNFDVFI